ncbi:MAG: cryptochrome/photolyase family protein [Bacteroidota bacterium]
MPHTLRLILGDQLNSQHSWFQQIDEEVLFVMMEVRQETDYVKHHIQKVVAFFAAMRAFASEREAEGHQFVYLKLDDPSNLHDIPQNIDRLIEAHQIEQFEYQLPDEYRLDEQMRTYCEHLTIATQAISTAHFLTEREDLKEMFKGKKTYLMESFYRNMRKKYHIMMETETQPVTGKWNYDANNRNKYDGVIPIPTPLSFHHDVKELVGVIEGQGVETIGNIDPENFIWPVTRGEALQALDFFIDECLPYFGTYQDSMTKQYWSLFHARISFPLNSKILSPLEVVERTVAAWEANPDKIDIAQIEGFVRQIIGWREYMRGVYWAHMPKYEEQNYFNHTNKLPSWFWTGETKMNCLRHAIQNSLDNAYAHHIQRLMVTGNFALLAGVHPDELDAWYLGIYIDAIQWVEITNTRGMSQYADGGLVGTKPYVSSANYIDKMSDYCKGCHYSKSKKFGEKACPFNSLYWHFYKRHEDKLAKNPRIGMVYPTLRRMKNVEEVLAQGERYMENLENL